MTLYAQRGTGVSQDRRRAVRTLSLISKGEGWTMGGTSIVQRGKRFAVVAYAGIDPQTGKERRKWFSGFATRREAEQFRVSLAHHPTFAAGAGPYRAPRLRLGDYLTAWLDERAALRQLRSRTMGTHKDMIRLHIAPHLGHIPVERLSPPAIQAWYVRLLDRGLSAATVRRASQVLHTALEDALSRGLISRNPMDNTEPPVAPQYRPCVLEPEQVRTYLEDTRVTATPAVFALHTVAIGCGLRLGELLGLAEDAVDLDQRLLHVHRTLIRAGATPNFGEPKTRAGRRTILLPEGAVDAIRRALLWKTEQRMRLGPRYRGSGLLFTGPTGRPLNPSNIRTRDHLPRLVRLRLPRTRLHDWRHLHATTLIAAGVDYRTVGDRMGHKSPSFTVATYAHAAAQAQEQAAAIANGLLTEKRGFRK